MTVQELINELQKIENKELTVKRSDWEMWDNFIIRFVSVKTEHDETFVLLDDSEEM